MKSKRLADLISKIDEDMLDQAIKTDSKRKFENINKNSKKEATITMKLFKLKKAIIIAACFCIVFFGTVGISSLIKNGNQKSASFFALEVAAADSADGGVHTMDYALWSDKNCSYHVDTSAKKEATVSFNGKTYTGEYLHSIVRMPNTYVSHYYKTDGVIFSIKSDTDVLDSIRFIYELDNKSTISETECKSIAENIINKYINVNDYTVETSIIENIYCFSYVRYINDIKSCDKLTISIDGSGNLVSFGYTMLGKLSGIKLENFNSLSAESAIKEKIGKIYNEYTSYNVKDKIVVLLEDGTIGMLYTVDVKNEKNKLDDNGNSNTIMLDNQIKLLVSWD